MFADECGAGGDKSWRAKAALLRVVFDKGALHFIQLCRRTDTLDGRDVAALSFDSEHRAGVNRMAIDDDGACAAGPAIANFLGAGQVESIAQCIEQGDTRLDTELA